MDQGLEKDPEFLEIGGHKIGRGVTQFIDLSMGHLYDFTEQMIPVCVIRASKPGPVFFLSGAVHGDEIIGTEIIKRLLKTKKLKVTHGTLIAVPIVNVYGYNSKSRYLPDRRDLNRSFPGSRTGSLSGRLAHVFLNEIVSKSHFGIDLHSAAVHRSNFPQIRACLDNKATEDLALAFSASVIINSKLRDGSIREVAEDRGVSVLVFEGGEALRHDEKTIKMAIKGIFNCLAHVGMLASNHGHVSSNQAFIAKSSYWMRASQSGVIRMRKSLGEKVEVGTLLGRISDVFGKTTSDIVASMPGVVIGENRLPLVNQGDALFHIATFDELEMEQLADDLDEYTS